MRADMVGIGLAAGELAAYVPLGHAEGEQLDRDAALERLRPLFADAEPAEARPQRQVPHGRCSRATASPSSGLAFDTMIAAYLLESGQRALALRDLAWAKVQVELPSVQSLLGIGTKAITMAELSIADCGSYACNEALLVERHRADPRSASSTKPTQTTLFRDVEMPLVPVLADMERVGIAVDLPYLAELGRELQSAHRQPRSRDLRPRRPRVQHQLDAACSATCCSASCTWRSTSASAARRPRPATSRPAATCSKSCAARTRSST